ncbi:pentapeptide repeat-containing protein [Streptomyces sp. NPDC051636]|uniref:pentapeptide repeat-containing protein n=1 Tax=Streptomyces sp. NPDC051636 TaxID=3365663 RepID=UPI00379CBD4B
MSTAPAAPQEPPSWEHCGHGADPVTDPVGCRGRHLPYRTACLAHASPAERDSYLALLYPGAPLDHRGTRLTGPLLRSLLDALRDPDTSALMIGDAWFTGAMFSDDAWFTVPTFTRDAFFNGATFNGDAWFAGARFKGDAWFAGATFSGVVRFDLARFHCDARFDRATFAGESMLGPLVCVGSVGLDGAVFETPATIEIAATAVNCRRTRWMSTAALRLRYATADLTDAVLSSPVAVTAHPTSFTPSDVMAVDESLLADADRGVRVTSVRGVDAAHLVLTDTDLSACRFFGAFHLDQLRIEGHCTFAPVPEGWYIRPPFRWTRRRTLAEEHHWRATRAISSPSPPRRWLPGSPSDRIPQPAEVAATYRQLRKAPQDSKDEPGSADFYYGEMEMRRHDRTPETTAVERGLLGAYWILSGYGLRASRALVALGLVMTATVLALMMWGLPSGMPPPTQYIKEPLPAGQRSQKTLYETYERRPGGRAPGPWSEKFSRQRTERALRTSVNSVLFRSAGQGFGLGEHRYSG